jgi:hypothetical protein
MNKKLKELILTKNWKALTTQYSPDELSQILSFENGLKLAFKLLSNDQLDEDLQIFSTKLLESIRITHPKNWASSWRFDGFLGTAYDIILDYDKRYEALKRAMDQVTSPPSELLIAFARCADRPGEHPVPYDQAITFLKTAIKDTLYVDGVGALSLLYALKRDDENSQYWQSIFRTIEKTNKFSPSLEPEFVRKELTEE